jgi:exonuclease SbcD
MAAFRFIHSADIHLDSPLRSLGLRNPTLGALIGNATRQAFVRIIDLCLEEQVDALVLAGDLYDGDQTSMKTARFFASQLRRLSEAGIRVFIVSEGQSRRTLTHHERAYASRARDGVRWPG